LPPSVLTRQTQRRERLHTNLSFASAIQATSPEKSRLRAQGPFSAQNLTRASPVIAHEYGAWSATVLNLAGCRRAQMKHANRLFALLGLIAAGQMVAAMAQAADKVRFQTDWLQ
jgi:hypothetical protein